MRPRDCCLPMPDTGSRVERRAGGTTSLGAPRTAGISPNLDGLGPTDTRRISQSRPPLRTTCTPYVCRNRRRRYFRRRKSRQMPRMQRSDPGWARGIRGHACLGGSDREHAALTSRNRPGARRMVDRLPTPDDRTSAPSGNGVRTHRTDESRKRSDTRGSCRENAEVSQGVAATLPGADHWAEEGHGSRVTGRPEPRRIARQSKDAGHHWRPITGQESRRRGHRSIARNRRHRSHDLGRAVHVRNS